MYSFSLHSKLTPNHDHKHIELITSISFSVYITYLNSPLLPPPPSPTTTLSPRPHRRPRRRITRRHRIININLNPLIRRTIRARKADQGTRRSIPSILHLDLRTAYIKLRAADATRTVQRNVLDAQQILARGERFRDRNVDVGFAGRGPRHLAPAEGRALRVDLEPYGA